MVGGHRQSSAQRKSKYLAAWGIPLLLSLALTACGGDSNSGEAADSSGDESNIDLSGDGGAGETNGDTTGSDCAMTPDEEDMLQQVNTARSQARECGSTHYTAVAPLKWDCKLQRAALSHSSDMAEHNFFDHTGSNGLGPGYRIEQQGYQARTWGENIAAGYPTVEVVVEAWLQSPGHCRNLMKSNFTDLGMANVENSGSNYRNYWTQVFGKPAQQTVQSLTPSQTTSG